MTAVAYRGGFMAADTAAWGCSSSHVIVGHRQKILRLPDGGLFSGCGRSSDLARVFDVLLPSTIRDGKPVASFELKDEGFAALVVQPDGVIWRIENDMIAVRQNVEFICVGASEIFMWGALWAGASSEYAVRLAIDHTDGAAGAIQVERLRQ